jgi:RHS repeat-associated protein
VAFGYDALGRRVRKTFRGQSTKWVWDGNVPLHEWVEGKLEPLVEPEVAHLWSADPLIKKREAELEAQLAQAPPERGSKQSPITWLFEPESFAPLAKLVSGQQFSILTDHLGTPVLMSDEQGKAVWSTQHSVYGELRSLTGPRHACPFRWPGQYEDLETALYYNRFRYYDPEAGQYCTQDPIRISGGTNLSAYVADPLVWTDPLGLNACGPSVRKKARALREGNDVEVSSFKEADAVLSEAFPNARKVRGAGNKSSHRANRQKKAFKRTPSDQRAERAVYHKDYQYGKKEPGVLAGHEDLPDTHPHKHTPHINVLTPEGSKVTIFVRR